MPEVSTAAADCHATSGGTDPRDAADWRTIPGRRVAGPQPHPGFTGPHPIEHLVGVKEKLPRLAQQDLAGGRESGSNGPAAPAGTVLMPVDEILQFVRLAPGRVVANHLEALNHGPTTRDMLRSRLSAAGLEKKVAIPADGTAVEVS